MGRTNRCWCACLPWLLLCLQLCLLMMACGGDDGGADAGRDAAVDAVSDAGDATMDSDLPDGSVDAASDASVGPTHDCTPNRYVTAEADGSGNGTMANPWSLAQAMAEASAGDVVVVGPGVYTAPTTGERYAPAFNPTNSGAAGAPIVFCAERPAVHNETGRSELRNDAAAEGTDASPTFGVNGRDHVVWDGFYVDESRSPSHPDTGPVVVWDSRDITMARNVIDGATFLREDNHNGIRIEGAQRVSIVENRISGVHNQGSNSRNHAAIMTYDSSFVTIEHNDIRDCDDGMYIKGDHADDGLPNGAYTVRFNHLTDILGHAITILGVVPVGDDPSDFSQNLIEDSRIGFLFNSVGPDHPASVRVHHNTIVGSNAAFFPNAGATMFDFQVTQNLVQGGDVFLFESLGEPELRVIMGNGYLSDDNHAFMHGDWAFGRDLGEWQSFSGLDAESSVGDPLFVNEGAGDYHLGAGSPALTASTDGGPVGCYVSGDEAIGVTP